MTTKKYVWILVTFFGLFFFGNLALWYGYTGKTFQGGDLLRLGAILPVPSQTQRIREKDFIEFPEYLANDCQGTFDILTIGDSFSNITGYQNDFVTKYDLSVLHVPNHGYDAISLYYMLDKFGYIDRIRPKIVILESVERGIHGSFGTQILSTPTCKDASFRALMKKPMYAQEESAGKGWMPCVMVKANANLLFFKLRFFHHLYRVSNTTNVVPLTRDVFSAEGREHTLIFYNDDLNYLHTPANIDRINENLNAVATSMHAKGIRFVFLPAPDKFDVYYPELTPEAKARWPESPFFDEMRAAKKDYIFIDSQKLLRDAIKNGEKDVYLPDDTHWSWKAGKIVCADIMRQLNATNENP